MPSIQAVRPYLIPMLLNTPFGSRWERLTISSQLSDINIENSGGGQTLAISAQLLPASRICLSLNSSAGVQGVFVRLFLTGGGCEGVDVDETEALVVCECDVCELELDDTESTEMLLGGACGVDEDVV